jgi:hypothetical protein
MLCYEDSYITHEALKLVYFTYFHSITSYEIIFFGVGGGGSEIQQKAKKYFTSKKESTE